MLICHYVVHFRLFLTGIHFADTLQSIAVIFLYRSCDKIYNPPKPQSTSFPTSYTDLIFKCAAMEQNCAGTIIDLRSVEKTNQFGTCIVDICLRGERLSKAPQYLVRTLELQNNRLAQ